MKQSDKNPKNQPTVKTTCTTKPSLGISANCLRHLSRLLWLSTLVGFTFAVRVRAANVVCGETITNSISAPSENDLYTYNGTNGQVLSIGFVGGGPPGIDQCFYGYNTTLDLYNPTNQKIASLSHCGVRSTNLTLTANGQYYIVVHDDDGAQTNTYAFSVQSVTGGGCSNTPIACGQTISSNLSREAEIDAFSYVGVAGQKLSFSFVGGGRAILFSVNSSSVKLKAGFGFPC